MAGTIGRERPVTFQGFYERDVGVRVVLHRAESLDIGDESLCFGRTDAAEGDTYYIGRRAVFSDRHDPLVIDWRVPAAEPFYRATGRDPLGLKARRHFLCEGRTLLSVEEERFDDPTGVGGLGLAGTGALIAALERPRSGLMRDIVATVQAEQDMIIRDDVDGVLAVQGGPGTGKTAVALHRAAFLLFTHRRKLARQGVLVVGPNHHFLRYIEQVLPALGESGAVLATPADLVPDVELRATEEARVARVKGDLRMTRVVGRAVRDRQKPLTKDVVIGIDDVTVTLRAKETEDLIAKARRSRRSHNARHAMLASIIVARLHPRYVRAMKAKHGEMADMLTQPKRVVRPLLRAHPAVQSALDEMWPLLSTKRLLAELLSSRARIASATRGLLRDRDAEVLYRQDGSAWTAADVPLLDEAFTHLGAPVAKRRSTDEDGDRDLDERYTFGHIVVDEAQDLSPMALRMLTRRSRNGSMTVVGDLAQAVGIWTPGSWDELLAHLPNRKPRVRELTINYRTPAEIADLAATILKEAAPDIIPPSSVRESGSPPRYVQTEDVLHTVAHMARGHAVEEHGTMVLVAPPSMIEEITRVATIPRDDIGAPVTVMSVEDAKGLEFDEVVVVEPARIVSESMQGLRALYVALTRATQRATIVYAEPLPAPLKA